MISQEALLKELEVIFPLEILADGFRANSEIENPDILAQEVLEKIKLLIAPEKTFSPRFDPKILYGE